MLVLPLPSPLERLLTPELAMPPPQLFLPSVETEVTMDDGRNMSGLVMEGASEAEPMSLSDGMFGNSFLSRSTNDAGLVLRGS